MDNIKLFLLLLVVSISCSKFPNALESERAQDEMHLSLQSKTGSKVSLEAVEFKMKGLQTKSGGKEILSIEPVVDIYSDTLMYIVNYTSGWTIVSADKRTPAILGTSESGSLSVETENAALRSWLASMAIDMHNIKYSRDSHLSFSPEELASNISFWDGIDFPIDSIATERTGHYEAYSYSMTERYYDQVSHLLSTQWHQQAPYNEYCPMSSDGVNNQPAGCVAVAGAQMLYYLYNKIGKPANLYPSYVWEQMGTVFNNDQLGYAAQLISHVGTLVNIQYGDNESLGYTQNLVDDVFGYYGIDCSYRSFNASLVKSSLQREMPVIVRASTSSILNFFEPNLSHSFIIDGYFRVQVGTTVLYHWVDERGMYDPSEHPDYTETFYDNSPQIIYVKMNWGSNGQWSESNNYVNDGWYALTSDWYFDDGREILNFSNSRYMIYGFN